MNNYSFDVEKWQGLSVFDQMGNIGSEVGRAFSAKRRGDEIGMKAALYRGLDLIDATVAGIPKGNQSRLREILRAREQFAELEDESIEQYFLNFAIAARLRT